MLNDAKLRAAKQRDKAYKLTDAHQLYLFVTTTGSKLWRMDYAFDGKRKCLSIGPYPLVSLIEAREKRDDARKLLAEGKDPSVAKKLRIKENIEAARMTFELVAREWHEANKPQWAKVHAAEVIRTLERDVFPRIGSLPIRDLTPPKILEVLRAIEDRSAIETAKRIRQRISTIYAYAIASGLADSDPAERVGAALKPLPKKGRQPAITDIVGLRKLLSTVDDDFARPVSRVFRYGIATARCDRDVAADLRGALTTPKAVHHAAIIDPHEVGVLLKTMDGYTGQAVTRMALRLSPHLFVRPGELRQAEWAEIDVEKAIWSIPIEKMKMRRPHRVPLSRQVLVMIEELREITGHRQYLFPCMGSPRRPMSENGVNQALRRLGYDTGEMTAHGFRAMAATLLNEMGQWNPDAIERQLAHQDTSAVRRAYARGEYWDERVAMMQHWSDYLDGLREAAAATRSPKAASGKSKVRKPKAGRPRGRPRR